MFHPQPQPNGQPVKIHHLTAPTPSATWEDWQAVATCVPGGPVPDRLNDLPLVALRAQRGEIDWSSLAQNDTFDEPAFTPSPGLKAAAGAVVVEPHGRVWVVHPTNGYGGYQTTFPKGRVAPGSSLRETAVREVYEESGLVVEIIGFLVDSPRSTTYTRYYLARRRAGSPADMGWESQAVSLVPLRYLRDFVNQSVDKVLVASLLAQEGKWGQWFPGSGPLVDGHRVATRYSWLRHPLPRQHLTLAIDVRLDEDQAARVRRGFIPAAMEQKWFAYFEANVLYQHRSWTGYLIFVTPFTAEGEGLRATQTLVNQDPAQFGEIDEKEIRDQVEQLIANLAKAPANEDLEDPFVTALTKAMQPNYLGTPSVVSGEVAGFVDTVVRHWLSQHLGAEVPKVSYTDVLKANQRLTRIFAGLDPDYTVIGPWNSAAQLGVAVVRALDMDPDYYADENLTCILSEGLAGVTLTSKALLDELVTAHREWEEVQPRLQGLVDFVSAVLMGTHSGFFPGKTLKDFASQPSASEGQHADQA
jgi:8-oxo-dGTP pyrophosphatase MutT (NUDIX family)